MNRTHVRIWEVSDDLHTPYVHYPFPRMTVLPPRDAPEPQVKELGHNSWTVLIGSEAIGTLRLQLMGRQRRRFFAAVAHDGCDLGSWSSDAEAAAHIAEDWWLGCPRDPRRPMEKYRWQFGREGDEPLYRRRT